MANLIKNSPSVHEILTNSVTLGDFILQVREFDQELHTEILRYIHDYGDRVAGELKLESLSLRQDATFLLELLRAQTASECMTLEEFRSSEISLRQHAEAKVFEAFRKKGFGAGIIFKRNLNKFRQGIVFRERMRMSRTRVFGLFRMYYQALGERWYSSGLIEQERDIFYLTENEIIELSEGRSAILNIQGQVDLRKADLDSAEGEEPPAHFSTSLPLGKKADFRRPALSIAADLRGLGCFPGAIEGEVQIVRNPSEVHPEEIRGKILVALRTDPGWAPLFMYIKGLIVEKGSSLSHSAIVARELRLPTVVGVSEITQKLKSGDVIRLNGETGQIEIVKKQKLKESNDANRSVTA
jgi:pyruvate,water dikinase